MEAMKAKRVENEAKKEAYKAKKEAQKAAEEKKAADDAARIAANEKAIAAAAAARQAVLEAGIQKARTVQKKLNEQFLAQEQAKRDAKTPSPPAHSPYILEDADLEDSDLEEGEIREEVAQMTPNPITWVPMAADPTDPDARAKDEAEILHSAGDHVFTNPFFKGEKTRKSY